MCVLYTVYTQTHKIFRIEMTIMVKNGVHCTLTPIQYSYENSLTNWMSDDNNNNNSNTNRFVSIFMLTCVCRYLLHIILLLLLSIPFEPQNSSSTNWKHPMNWFAEYLSSQLKNFIKTHFNLSIDNSLFEHSNVSHFEKIDKLFSVGNWIKEYSLWFVCCKPIESIE